MTPHIVNVTNNLIGTYSFDRVFQQFQNSRGELESTGFINHVSTQIYAGDYHGYTAATLGCIIDGLTPEESPRELSMHVKDGDYLVQFRKLVSRIVAYQVYERLKDGSKHPYKRIQS